MHRSHLFVLVAVAALAACGGNDNGLPGFSKSPPDAFSVISKPALVIPPEYALRPPKANATGPKQTSHRENAQKILGLSGDTNKTLSPLEKRVLAAAGAKASDGEIRNALLGETRTSKVIDDATVAALTSGKAVVVNPAVEKARIDDQILNERPINEGATAVEDDRGIFGRLFGG